MLDVQGYMYILHVHGYGVSYVHDWYMHHVHCYGIYHIDHVHRYGLTE